MKIILRAEAKAIALKQYFTGKPCKQGHLTWRITINGYCLECSRLSCKNYRSQSPEKFAASKARTKAKRLLRRDELLETRRQQKLERNPRLATSRFDKQSRASALAAGEITYQSQRPCKYGHVGVRFSSSYGCVECHALALKPDPPELIVARIARRADSKKRSEAKAQVTIRRAAAIAAGETTFIGSPCLRGHDGLRWVSSYACVECGKRAEKKEKKCLYDQEYRKAHPELLERSRQWSKKNPARRKSIVKAYTARRRSQEKAGDPTRLVHAWEMAAKKVCYWCGVKCPKKYHVDHYQPLSKGGAHAVANLVIACPKCNLTKNAKDPYEFAASVGRLF